MADYVFNRLKYNLMKKLVDLSADTIKCALMDTSYTPDPDDNVWGDVSADEISGTGYTAGGEALTGLSVTQDDTGDRALWDATDVQWTSASFTAYYAVLYDVTVTSNLICEFDFGGAKTVTSGTFTIQWSSSPAAIMSLT